MIASTGSQPPVKVTSLHLETSIKCLQPLILTIYNDSYDILIDDAIVYPTEMPTTTVSYRGGRGRQI